MYASCMFKVHDSCGIDISIWMYAGGARRRANDKNLVDPAEALGGFSATYQKGH